MRPIRAFYNGLVGGLAVGVLLGVQITEYYFANALSQYGYDTIGISNSQFLIWLVIVGIVLAVAYETHIQSKDHQQKRTDDTSSQPKPNPND